MLLVLAAGCFYLNLRAQSANRTVWDGIFTDAQASRGKPLYGRECAKCHGDELTGGEEAPPLAGEAFLSNWNGLTVGDLFDRIRKSMPQQAPGTLSRQQNADILAFMLIMNHYPAGKTELQTQSEILKQIKIEPKPGE
jgi:cytochrome c